MKLDPRQAAAFLRDPGVTRLVLLYGEDEGQIRERTHTLTRQVVSSLSDPFLIAELARESWNQIPSEMAALSMVGGRRVVIARDATDAILPFISAAMAGPGGALLIVEAPGLSRGKLRSYVEASPQAAALASYAEEGAALQATITAMLAERNIRVQPDAMSLLCRTLAADRAVLRGEIEKLALFAEPGQALDADTIQACTGDIAAGSGDEAILAMTAGDLVRGDAALEAAFADGLTGVTLLRMALAHLQKLHMARLHVDNGASSSEAIRTIRPPVFYKNVSLVTKSLTSWSADKLLKGLDEARKAELASKQTGSIPDLLTRRFLYGIARLARQ